MEDIYNQDPYQKAFESYQRLFSLSLEDLQKSILDVGAGSGDFIHYLRSTLGNKNAYGVEKNKSRVGPDEEGMVVTDGFQLPFADESFELVIAKNYLPMFVDEEEKMQTALQELIRVVKHGGKVIGDISTPENEIRDMEKYKDVENDERTETWRKKRHEGAKKLISYLEILREGGLNIERENQIITIRKT